ncbi:efflux RND transporter permease subunit [Novosphingobium sp.]|uniref:efflux RND transporter permease subunit n=1 Tax=Novosphingobium sp. TaxID=1874826 RepID=UPI003BAAED4B
MNRLLRFALRQRLLIVAVFVTVLVAGGFAFAALNIEAYPDPVPPMVEIVTQTQGLSAEEMERNVTVPIEVAMAGIPHLTTVRAISLFGLSDVKVQFSYDLTYQEAQQQVINRLAQLPPLAGGAQPTLSPTSPIGEIYRYRIVAPDGYSPMDLKTLQDWILQRRFKRIPGVADVTGWGGKLRTYDVTVDNDRLVAHGVTMAQVMSALAKSDSNVGGQTINFGAQAAIVRGVGLIQSPSAIENVLVGTAGSAPVLLKDVAQVSIGNQPRLGIAGYNGLDDIVEGIVLMQRGAKSMPTIEAVQKEVAEINASGILPPGVHLERVYDRSDLIRLTTHTVLENLMAGIILIFALQWIFLGNLRSAIIVAATIPFALAIAVLILVAQGESANLLSVGALDFGLVVDASVIMVENIFRHMVERSVAVESGHGHFSRASRMSAILHAGSEVSRGIFFAAAIIIASFIPLFTLTGVEGHIFGPMAKTYAYAITGGVIATFTVTPVLAAIMLPDSLSEVETRLVAWLRRVYEPAAAFAQANRVLTFGGAAIALALAGIGVRSLGIEFLPHLEEGNLYIRASLPPSISLEAGQPVVNAIRRDLARYPEIEAVLSAHGRPDDGTDATGFFNAEYFVPLKPAGEWPSGMTKEKLVEDMSRELGSRYPGVDFSFSQIIEDNVEEAASGVKGANSIKLYGPDLATLEKTADAIKAEMAKVKGIADLGVFQSLGQPTVRIEVDLARASRYGLTPDDINQTVAAAIGGSSTAQLYEPGTDRHFPIVVRLRADQRSSLEAIRQITVGAPSPDGKGLIQVPLSEVANIHLTTGASFIYREHQERYIPIKFSVRGRDLGSVVAEAKARIKAHVTIPPGYHLEWAGELDNLQNAIARLEIVVPISLILILILLYANFGSIRDTLLAFSAIPMAIVGGVLALALTGTAFSISAAIGFVALFGIAVMDGILIVTTFNQVVDDGATRHVAVRRATSNAMRPVLMTCLVAAIGLLPAALSNGIGSQVQKPLALVVVGGMALAPLLILLVLPALVERFSLHLPEEDRGPHGRDIGHHTEEGEPA